MPAAGRPGPRPIDCAADDAAGRAPVLMPRLVGAVLIDRPLRVPAIAPPVAPPPVDGAAARAAAAAAGRSAAGRAAAAQSCRCWSACWWCRCWSGVAGRAVARGAGWSSPLLVSRLVVPPCLRAGR